MKSSLNAVQHMSIIKENDEWGTPHVMFSDACREYHIFPKIDVAASDLMHVLPEYLTKQEDFLSRDIDIDAFGNFPYSLQAKMIRHAYSLHKRHNTNWLILAFAKTDTKWWHEYVEDKAEVHFIKGRVKFLKNGIKAKSAAPYPSCWIIYRRK
jgi:hypothetical protein